MMQDGTPGLSEAATRVLDALSRYREADAPTHGGRVLSYVYDSGISELDELAAQAARLVQSVNGLDPTAFPSVALLERELVGFSRALFNGDDEVVGTVTSGGTESCLLAVKTARDLWRNAGNTGRARIVGPITIHAAFRKAAHYFDLDLDLVDVDPETGTVDAADVIARLAADVALVVVSAPNYPYGQLDPIGEVAAAAAERGISCHVDACIGGWALPWWEDRDAGGGELPEWDFRVPGVTSLSADLHKYGFAPKGASILLHRGRARLRAQYFALSGWSGYPVVNATMLGSKSAGALAAAWAIVQRLGSDGFSSLVARTHRATSELRAAIDGIPGLRIVGDPAGPLFAVARDTLVAQEIQVDPHHWADAVNARGWLVQQQPGLVQPDGASLPRTSHFTITPVTLDRLPELIPDLISAADSVRGIPPVDGPALLASLPPDALASLESGDLSGLGFANGAPPAEMAPLMALIETLPSHLVEQLLIEVLAQAIEPH